MELEPVSESWHMKCKMPTIPIEMSALDLTKMFVSDAVIRLK